MPMHPDLRRAVELATRAIELCEQQGQTWAALHLQLGLDRLLEAHQITEPQPSSPRAAQDGGDADATVTFNG